MAAQTPRARRERLQERLNALHRRRRTWKGVAKLYGVSTETAWRMAQGREPLDPKARRAFGLPLALTADVQYDRILMCRRRKCRKTFIPNNTARVLCFECSPKIKRKK